MCTVLLRFRPDAAWPLLLAAIRDEFADRPWDPPRRHWDGPAAGLVGGRDRVAGGTWLAVAPDLPALAPDPLAVAPGLPAVTPDPLAVAPGLPAVAALLNGVRREVPATGRRPSRGSLPLTALTADRLPDPDPYDGFHLLRAGPDRVEAWTWDTVALRHRMLEPGDHLLVNAGIDPPDHPLVTHFGPRLRAAGDPDPRPGLAPAQAWGDWLRLLAGDGLDPADPRALVVQRTFAGRRYASTSATLLALRGGEVRYDFTASPGPAARWWEVDAYR